MIDTGAIRIKAVSMAVLGELTVDYISNSKADEDFRNMKIVPKRIDSEEIPFELKADWQWVRMADLGADEKNSFADGPFGSNLKREHYTTEKQVRIIQLSNIGDLGWKDDNEKYTTYEHLETIKRSEVQPGNIVIAKMMPAGRAIIVPDISSKFVLSSDCIKFVPNSGLNVKYLCYAINSQLFRKQVLQGVHGIGRERTSLSKIKTFLLPIPPVDEQKEIANKLDAIFDLLNIIDALQSQYRNNLDALKSKIMDAGIRGKLTEQLPTDGTAEELYAQIQEEKARLVKEGKIKKEKPLPAIEADEIPFEIPKNWKWVRWGNVINIVSARRVHQSDWRNKGVPFYRAREIARLADEGSVNNDLFISEELYNEFSKSGVPKSGDLMVTGVGTLGKTYVVRDNDRFYYKDASVLCFENIAGLNPPYLKLLMDSSLTRSQIGNNSGGTTVDTLTMVRMNRYIFPLPPLAEQKRITEKIDEVLRVIQ